MVETERENRDWELILKLQAVTHYNRRVWTEVTRWVLIIKLQENA